MADLNLSDLEQKIDLLILACRRLAEENSELNQQLAASREREGTWQRERSRLIEKNELARHRVESMISRLKSLEEQA